MISLASNRAHAAPVPAAHLTTSDSSTHGQLTRRQRQVLEFIGWHLAHCGYPPTIREIAERFAIGSPNGVMSHLRALEAAGEIIRDQFVARGIRLCGSQAPKPARPHFRVRIAGKIKAGGLVEAIEDVRPLDWSGLFGDPENLVARQVEGDGLQDRGWLDGDWILFRDGRFVGLVRVL